MFGLSAGTASAQPACPDVHWMGAAGSGERTPADIAADDGMGRVVNKSYRDFAGLVQSSGRTITAEAVEYPAVPVPADGGAMGWLGFMGSVDTGAAALASQYAAFVAQCPTTQVVLAGYSQGAMVVHRNLAALETSPNLAAALLVADGDRLPADPTLNLGSVTAVPGRGKGVAQDWPILAHTPAPLTPAMGARTISVCDLGDAVCDYDPDAEDDMNPAAVAVHTSYARNASAMDAWTAPLFRLVQSRPVAVPDANPMQVAAGS
ncbi:cutinase [Mycolicibacterium chubuense]|uniref:Cutinase n=1 Tax=Mycolicibacterium chubuense TaxID=1800 RepID=A0A0J6WQG8_MYCCU|nr:cutinase family protein [Mycolicibacterium chubuense]KMO84804.1 Cutinase [Mycolicibacterium chubuense]ORA49800.1 cutinase [Mycolicibacterium chubuense]SPY00032.1 Cutinase [Mycolicibacterium chubuense]